MDNDKKKSMELFSPTLSVRSFYANYQSPLNTSQSKKAFLMLSIKFYTKLE